MVRENREYVPKLPDQFIENLDDAEETKEAIKPIRVASAEAGTQGEVAESSVRAAEIDVAEQLERQKEGGKKIVEAKLAAGMEIADLRGLLEDQRDEVEAQIDDLEDSDDVQQTEIDRLYNSREVLLTQIKMLEELETKDQNAA